MKKTDTIYYSGQGYIYRCPGCNKVDRMPWNSVPESAECRFCGEEFQPVSVPNMTPDLYGVIREINQLETGTVFGMSPEDLQKTDLAKAGKSVGIDVAGQYVSPPIVPGNDIQAYFESKKTQPNALKKMYETPEGREVLDIAGSLLMKKKTAAELVAENKSFPNEVLSEARMRYLIKHNKGLNNDQKMALLKKHGFDAYIGRKGKPTVFFPSSYAPECDAWLVWDDDAKEGYCE